MTLRNSNPRSVLITGASSGIGAALAQSYAAPGVHLALSGRDWRRLDEVAESCRALGAEVRSRHVDVLHRVAMADWIAEVDDHAPLELVVANAGVSAGTGQGGESDAQVRRIFAINIDGVVNTVLPAVERMRPRRRGQVAIVSSLAAFRGFPGAPAYCASKAAVRVWGESLRAHLKAEGIAVNVICPGFVKSRMTAVNEFPMPLLMDSDKASRIIRRGLARDKARIVFPWRLWAAVWLLAALPPGLTDRLLARLPEKG
ncbi:SDR family NAD(P)-dependent oxidoreductase [Ferruginivarius sediminum]|uniref:SDR family NAD(P)-dependent oxidoreductase n=1 Tax=Ferruginivarius sediminum TaxID=2661937 RepID=A0A369TAV0_9PROT|nr:SDR family NAD(P)-dependent oxidoreductase [Ferruginivarius sediminum]RDD62439.1 SDR family NAD(P)-dependent oxidoreductase [Ferruginivarius sediminum]